MKALKQLNLDNVIIFDIETAPVVAELIPDTHLYESWEYKKARDGSIETQEDLLESYKTEAGLYPEFAKIICISFGKVKEGKINVVSYYGDSEKDLLNKFTESMNNLTSRNNKIQLCGHAIKGFDIPFVFKRCLINGVEPNDLFDLSMLKPWEATAVDTSELWKGTQFTRASLINLTTAFGLPSPKDDISGSEVGAAYWAGGNLEKIKNYCEKDVVAVANVVRKCRFEDIVKPEFHSQVQVEKLDIITYLYNGGELTEEKMSELVEAIQNVTADVRGKAFDILESVAAKRSTKIKKGDVNKLRKTYGN